MMAWRPQRYKQLGQRRGVDADILQHALEIGKHITHVDSELPPVFTLRHLAYLSNASYGFLRAIVSRDINDAYRTFPIRKTIAEPRRQSFRIICIPDPPLMRVQRWIANRILSRGRHHHASFAYARKSSIKQAAQVHCECRWMIKCDVRRFFESISEIAAYRVFQRLGYQPLVSFELARICTRLGALTPARSHGQWRTYRRDSYAIDAYQNARLGHLPQGAPTSPMLSNLAMVRFDCEIDKLSGTYDLAYTRYADDICLSSRQSNFDRRHVSSIIGEIYRIMGNAGLSPNFAKTRIIPPGARKICLGLLVDGSAPRLSREFRARMRQHIYYLCHPDVGPARHAAARGFTSVLGLKHHIEGLVAFARDIDRDFAEHCDTALARVSWPL
jgi:RNA-directed DNA polymerase